MIIDSSVVAAIFLSESEADPLLKAIVAADAAAISAANALEVGIVLSHRKARPMHTALCAFFDKVGIDLTPFDAEHWAAAMAAWWRYGKSRSPAGLNFGDCIAYATARLAGEPLLCKGNDFEQTDLELVRLSAE